jgi:hypothetical protein
MGVFSCAVSIAFQVDAEIEAMKPMEIFIIGTVAMHVDTISLES